MLKFLHIENIAVIEQADIEFSEGFNVLTGETGAGKSIIIDSINAILGERTSKEIIRAGCDNAEVSAVFGELAPNSLNTLKEYDFTPDEDGNIVILRRLSNSGKGFIKLNNRPITAAALREIGKNLINIHGQHDNQALLDPAKHYEYIDLFADNGKLIEAYYTEFKRFNSIRKELELLESSRDAILKEADILKYRINELQEADIKPGEIKELKEKLEISKTYESVLAALTKSYNALKGNDDFDGASTLIKDSVKSLISLKQPKYDGFAEKLNEALMIIEDVSTEIDDFLYNTDFSELDSNVINTRLDKLDRLMVKYGGSEEQMLIALEEAKTRLNELNCSDERITDLSLQLDESTEKLIDSAKGLTESRKKAAEKFEKNISDILMYLNMPDVKFSVDFKTGKYTKHGCDVIEFLISANKGEDVKPLYKIASGGELSRVMLSIKSVLLDRDNVGTMIFDEIDTGISGYTAGKVGVQLKKVSKNNQVICVTHLAQIAAMADNHLLIEKKQENGRTNTKVQLLAYDDRINEIARIMSGSELTENLYNSAKELLDRSKNNENL